MKPFSQSGKMSGNMMPKKLLLQHGLREDAPVLNYVYTLYDGSALLDEPGKYLTEWNPDAATLTLVLQEEVSTWNTASDFAETNYHIYSDEIVINLKK